MALTIQALCGCIEGLRLVAGDGGETVRCICAVEGLRSAALAERDCLVLPLCSDAVPLQTLISALNVSAVLLEESQLCEEVLTLCSGKGTAVLSFGGAAEEAERKCRFRLEEELSKEAFAMLTVQAAMSVSFHPSIYQMIQQTCGMEQICLTAIELRTAEGQPVSELRCSELLRQLRYETCRSETPVIWMMRDGVVCGLFGCTDEETRVCVEHIVHCEPEEQLHIAVSRTTQNFGDLPLLGRHVRLMLKLLWSEQLIGTVCSYRDLGMYQVLMSVDDPEAMQQFYEKTLAPLVRYDEENGTDYVGLLQCYLSHDAGVSATAAALFLHRNSVNYKLNRIQEILGCSLSRQTVRSQLLVAFMIRELL